jgi:hypothetical protein
LTYGKQIPNPPGESLMERQDENLAVVAEVVAVLDSMSVPYALGGSMASGFLGKPRFTADADLTVEPFPGREAEFCARFGPDYYVSVEAVRGAVRGTGSFNLIHTPSAFKVDVFVRKDRPFDHAVLARRRSYPIAGEPGGLIWLVSAEDIVLLKLEWFRLGDECSERQFSDVIGVLQVQAGKLDESYLDRWASDLGVSELLERARRVAAELSGEPHNP